MYANKNHRPPSLCEANAHRISYTNYKFGALGGTSLTINALNAVIFVGSGLD